MDRVLALAARPGGARAREVADSVGININTTSAVISSLERRGQLFKSGVKGSYRFFTDAEAAKAHQHVPSLERKVASGFNVPINGKRPAPGAAPYAGPKVTIAPPFVDRRFEVALPPGGGQITRDWRERRMQEHK